MDADIFNLKDNNQAITVIKGPILKNGWSGFYLTIIQCEIEQPWKWKHISYYSPSYPLEMILNTIENMPTMELFKVLFLH